MRERPSRPRTNGASRGLPVACLALALTGAPSWGQETDLLSDGDRDARAAPEALARPDAANRDPNPAVRIEELLLQVQGMEGKLRDSAAARKSADQARMEAERRLAEAIQEQGRLQAEIELLREARQAQEASVKREQEQAARIAESLAAAEERIRHLGAEREGDALRIAGLERRLEETGSEVARIAAALDEMRAERDTLARRLEQLKTLVPVAEGGTLTLDLAQQRAAVAAESHLGTLRGQGGTRDAAGRLAVQEAERALQRAQLAVARLSGARGLYRVRPSDSLALIANRLYGDGSRWRGIRDANRHILDDPDRLTPGITLVIP